MLRHGSHGHANAALFFAPDVAHVVLFGPVLELLDESELEALFGHELTHHRLFTMDDGVYFAAHRLLDANCKCADATLAQLLTERRYRPRPSASAARRGAR